jgi:hypothetical protein
MVRQRKVARILSSLGVEIESVRNFRETGLGNPEFEEENSPKVRGKQSES